MDVSSTARPVAVPSQSQGARAGASDTKAPAAPPPAATAPSAAAAATPSRPASEAVDVHTHFDPMTKTLVASVVDKESGSVVTEVPPEALRVLAMRTAEFRGKIFDAKF